MQQKARKPKESKFVSVFSDSKPDSDISFRDAAEGLLKQSAERYMVGVDNLSISMDGFSMVDQRQNPRSCWRFCSCSTLQRRRML